jgi:hypothetical protein
MSALTGAIRHPDLLGQRGGVIYQIWRNVLDFGQHRQARTPAVGVGEILPDIVGPIIVEGTVRLGYAIFTSATLSFLTLGIFQIPDTALTPGTPSGASWAGR